MPNPFKIPITLKLLQSLNDLGNFGYSEDILKQQLEKLLTVESFNERMPLGLKADLLNAILKVAEALNNETQSGRRETEERLRTFFNDETLDNLQGDEFFCNQITKKLFPK